MYFIKGNIYESYIGFLSKKNEPDNVNMSTVRKYIKYLILFISVESSINPISLWLCNQVFYVKQIFFLFLIIFKIISLCFMYPSSLV